MMEKEEEYNYVDDIISIARDDGCSAENALNMFLIHCIKAFDISKLYAAGGDSEWTEMVINEDRRYAHVISEWMMRVTKAIEKGESCDFFGHTYEAMFQSKGKASHLGQFFTPESIGRLTARITEHEEDEAQRAAAVYDCCCGSGRLLLSVIHPRQAGRPKIYIGDDIDIVSCRMCALNLMAHGCYGMVVCHDVLLDTVPSVIYVVNECKYPFTAVPQMCIRTMEGGQAERFWKKYKAVGLRLLLP